MADHNLRQTNALIVGGGAVGQVIGKHLALAGVHTGIFVKHKYASVADEGFELHHFAPFGKHTRLRYDDFKILHDPKVLSERHFDQVFVCVSSTDLRTGWLEKFFPHLRHSIWVIMQPGLRDYEYVASIVPERYIVQGTPGFMAYHGPLEGDDDVYPPGVAWWRPPFQATLFEGPDERTTTSVTRLLDAGGLKCGLSSNLMTRNLHRRALILTFAMGLETHGWSIDALSSDKGMLRVMAQVADELHGLVAQATGSPSRSARRYRRGWYWKLAMKTMRWFTPFPFEPFCKDHFTRHRDELERLLDDYEALAKTVGVSTRSMAALRAKWESQRRGLESDDRTDLTPAGMVVPELNTPGVSFGGGSSDSLPQASAPSAGSSQQLAQPQQPQQPSSQSQTPAAQRPFGSSASQSGSFPGAPSAAPSSPSQSGTFQNSPAPQGPGSAPSRPRNVGGARQIASGDVSETGPMDAQPPRRLQGGPGQSDDVSSTAPMKRQQPGPRHSLSFSPDGSRDDHTAPVEAQPAPSFLEEETDAGD